MNINNHLSVPSNLYLQTCQQQQYIYEQPTNYNQTFYNGLQPLQIPNRHMQQQAKYTEYYNQMQTQQLQSNPNIQQLNNFPNCSPQYTFLQQQIQNQSQQQFNNYHISPPISPKKKSKRNEMKQLNVVVVTMETNQEPYQMELKIQGNETSLKQVFDENVNNYWTKVFKGHSPKEPPSYSVFRKAMNIESTYFDEFQCKSLHILLLKCEGYKFPRNPNAHQLELFCNTHFYGPLVIAMNMNQVPYHLASFKKEYMEQIIKINEAEKRQYPPPYVPTNSQKKNKSMPFYVAQEQKGDFAEDLMKLKDTIDTDMFYMYRYKTAYCPQKNVKHDWATCIYAHRPQDFRRPPDQFVYLPDDCKSCSFDQDDCCPLGFKCKYSHSTYERLYHPLKYKTNPCDQSSKVKRKHCKRGSMCAFYHEKIEKRYCQTCPMSQPFLKIAGTGILNNFGNLRAQSPPVHPSYIMHQNSGNISPPPHFQQHPYTMQRQDVFNGTPPGLINTQGLIDISYRPDKFTSNSFYQPRSFNQQGLNIIQNPGFMDVSKSQSISPTANSSQNLNISYSNNQVQQNQVFQHLNPEFQSSCSSLFKERTLSNENAFASPGGLPYLSNYNIDENQDNDEMELYIDEDMQQQVLANIYSKQQENQLYKKFSPPSTFIEGQQ